MSNRGGEDTFEMPCLGRPFHLGMLYDCRSDRLVMGMTLWNEEVLRKATTSWPQTASDFEVIAEDSIEDKTLNLDIDASLKLSFLGGLVNVEGSAKYLDDRKSSKRQARVSLKYWSTTRVEKLTMEGLGNVQYPRVFDEGIATHVVTGVLYGAQAFFVFDRHVTESENYRDIHGHLKVLLRGLPGLVNVEGTADIGVKQNEKEDLSKFECKFYGDFLLKQNPSTFEEAIKVYRELPNLLGSERNENTVAKKVWLYPLSKLDSKAAQIVRDISSNLVNQTQHVTEDLHEAVMRSNDLKKREVCFSFRGIQEQLSVFKEFVGEYKADFTKSLTIVLPRIRGGGAEEAELAALLKANHASPFSHHCLTSWLDGKEREITVLTEYLQSMQREPAINTAFLPGELDSMVHSINNEFVLCFAFKIAGKHDTYLKKVYAYLHNNAISHEFKGISSDLWLENEVLTSDMMLQARQFRSFARANVAKEGLKFVVTDTSVGNTSGNKGAIITLYKDGVESAFEPPGQPGQPKGSSMSHSSIQLDWNKPEYGAQSVQFYTVSYSHSLDDQWKTCTTEGMKEMATINGLLPKTSYYFKVRAECEVGASAYSKVSEPILTKSLPRQYSLAKRMRAKCGLPIEDGPPLIYKLPVREVMRDDTHRISKCIIGKPSPFVSPEKVLMVLGATGSGKSTLINGMINYILGVQWDDDFRFKLITDEAGGKSQAHSQTQEITAYTVHRMEGSRVPYTMTIIDTPGFGDTRGLKRDREITAQIKEFFSIPGTNGLDHLDGIGFVTQASLARLTPTQQYIFDSILSTFGKDIANSIFMMVTFADGNKPPVMDAITAAQIPFADSFKFNNSALYSTGEDSDVEDEDDEFGEMFWKMGIKSFKNFFTQLAKVESVSLQLTKEVLEERQKLEVNIQGLQIKVKNGLSQIDVLHQEQRILRTREAEMAANQNFKYKVKVPKTKRVDLGGTRQYVTNCIQCNFTCHFPCGIPNNDNKAGCAAMDWSKERSQRTCEVCPCRGHWSKHVNNSYRFEEYEEEEERTIEDLKKRYEDAESGKTQKESMVANMEKHLEFLYTKVLEMVQQVKKSLNRLDEIALKANPLTEVEYIELLIESEKQQAKDGYQQRIQYYDEVKKQAELVRTVTVGGIRSDQAQKSSKRWWEKLKFW